jgi:hypothetical protein
MDDEKETKVRFETLSAEKIPFGKNNFLEVARKKAITDEGNSVHLSVQGLLPSGWKREVQEIYYDPRRPEHQGVRDRED